WARLYAALLLRQDKAWILHLCQHEGHTRQAFCKAGKKFQGASNVRRGYRPAQPQGVSVAGTGAQTMAIPRATKNNALRFADRGVTSSSGALSGALILKISTKSAIGYNPRTSSITMLA